MPILDINNNPLKDHLSDSPNFEGLINIEVGAGKNYYGKKVLP